MEWSLPHTAFGNKMRKLTDFVSSEEFKKKFPNLAGLFYHTSSAEWAVIIPVGLPVNSEFFRSKKFFAEIDITQLQALLYKFGLQWDTGEPRKLHDLEVEIEMLEGDKMWGPLPF